MKHVISFLFILLSNATFLKGQNPKLGSLTINDGLSQGMVFDILQDKDGFLWIATKDGLNRYDGYNFKIFSHSALAPYSLSGHIPTVLFEDSRGWLWVGTQNNGLNVFDKKTERFYHLSSNTADPSTLQSNNIISLAEDSDGDIWVGTESGLDRVTVPTKFELRHSATSTLNGVFPVTRRIEDFEQVNCIRFYEKKIRLGTGKGVYECLLSDNSPPVDLNWSKNNSPVHQGVFDIIEDKFGATWLIQGDGLIRVFGGKSTYIPFSNASGHSYIRAIKDRTGNLFVGYTKFQYLEIGPEGIVAIKDIAPFEEGNCTGLFIDRSGMVWVGTNGFGLRKYNPRTSSFHHLLKGHSIDCIFEDSEGNIWTWIPFKLYWTNRKTGDLHPIAGFPENTSNARNVFEDSKGRFWFHRVRNVPGALIFCFDPKTGVQKNYPYQMDGDPRASFMEDRAGNIWLGGTGGFLIKIDPHQDGLVRFDFRHLFPQKDTKLTVETMHQEKGGVFWIGTSLGLIRMEEKAKAATPEFHLFTANPGSLSENYILSILQDPEDSDILWIGTKGGGLNRFNLKTKAFSHVTTKDGLPNNVIYGISPDDAGNGQGVNLWLSTNRGLSCYNPKQGSFKNYLAADGLQDNEFNTNGYLKTKSGELIFGGINGINIFSPKQIQGNNTPPKVFITDLRVNNKLVGLNDSSILQQIIEFTPSIQLPYDQNMVAFSFAALDFTASEKNTYEYQMVGLESDWIKAGSRHEVVYTNLPAGKYTFQVRGANSSGVWSEASAKIGVVVMPPWWRTTWGWCLWIGLGVTLLFSLYRFQVNRIRLKNQLQYEQKEAERLAEIDRMKTDFFSNITHEFRTPLTLILEPLRQVIPQLEDPQVREKLVLAEKNSQQLLGLINQLLDLSKLESGAMNLDLRMGNTATFMAEIFDRFTPLAERKRIRFCLVQTGPLPEFYFDTQKVELIISNLLSNALKFTPDGGAIFLRFGPDEHLDANTPQPVFASIQVADTGIGISPKNLPKIFDRFYQADSSNTRQVEGTGIGLALAKELVELMGGQISVASPDPQSGAKGTIFSVKIPVLNPGVEHKSDFQVNVELAANQSATIALATEEENEPFVSGEEQLILIIEDNPELRHFISQSIAGNYRIVEAADGGEGVEKALECIPDLIISDLMMPVKDGYTVCNELKNHELTSHIPIILLTAKSAMDSKLQGLRTGADDYLTKPFNTDELLVRMSNLIEIRRLLRKKYSRSELTNGEAVTDQVSAASFSKKDHEFLNKITGLLEAQLENEQLSVEDIAKQLYVSRVQLHRKLKALTDQPANEFIRNYRLGRAYEMLRNKEGNVSEIAIRTGFNSQKYFSVRFKERFGVSPSEVK